MAKKYIDADLIKSTKGLYNDIDSCIDELLKARVGHNQENEGKALFRMEGLMVATLQQLDCIIDSLQQEQPDVDLEEAAAAIILIKHPIMKVAFTMEIAFYEMLELVKAGYELGLNARKEE